MKIIYLLSRISYFVCIAFSIKPVIAYYELSINKFVIACIVGALIALNEVGLEQRVIDKIKSKGSNIYARKNKK